jgi:hypothetical protein
VIAFGIELIGGRNKFSFTGIDAEEAFFAQLFSDNDETLQFGKTPLLCY